MAAGLFAGILDAEFRSGPRRRSCDWSHGRPCDRRCRRAERPRSDGYRPTRCDACCRWIRPRHGDAPKVPVRASSSSTRASARTRIRATRSDGPGGRRGLDLMDQAGGSPPWHRCPVRQPDGHAGRALAAGFVHRRSDRRRFTNESEDYMSFGQRVLGRERAGDPVESMWIVFDQSTATVTSSRPVFPAPAPPGVVVQGRNRLQGFDPPKNSPGRWAFPSIASSRPSRAFNEYAAPVWIPTSVVETAHTTVITAIRRFRPTPTCGRCARPALRREDDPERPRHVRRRAGRRAGHGCFARTAA